MPRHTIFALAGSVSLAAASTAAAADVCTVLADAARGRMLVRQGDCERRVTPASTFKIAISLMGYDSGFLKDEHTPALPFRQGYPDWLPSWRVTTDPEAWIRNSVVWYSQQVTRALGQARFSDDVARFGYGNGDVSGDPGKDNGLTRAWLSSSLAVSPIEQVAFLRKIVRQELPVSKHALAMTARITVVGRLANGWDVHGKTGTGFPRGADGSPDEDRAYGWFVGWATRDDRSVVFAHLIQDDGRETVSAGLRARDALMGELPAWLDALPR